MAVEVKNGTATDAKRANELIVVLHRLYFCWSEVASLAAYYSRFRRKIKQEGLKVLPGRLGCVGRLVCVRLVHLLAAAAAKTFFADNRRGVAFGKTGHGHPLSSSVCTSAPSQSFSSRCAFSPLPTLSCHWCRGNTNNLAVGNGGNTNKSDGGNGGNNNNDGWTKIKGAFNDLQVNVSHCEAAFTGPNHTKETNGISLTRSIIHCQVFHSSLLSTHSRKSTSM